MTRDAHHNDVTEPLIVSKMIPCYEAGAGVRKSGMCDQNVLRACTDPCAMPTVPGLCGPFFGSGLDVIWCDASVIAYACTSTDVI